MVTLPVDSNIESKEAKAGGNLAEKTYHEMDAHQKPRKSTQSQSSSQREVLVASAVQGIAKLPTPNKSGAVGPAPMELTDPKGFRHAPSRDKNKYDTSIDTSAVLVRERHIQEIVDNIGKDDVRTLFPWRNIGSFRSAADAAPSADSHLIRAYITERFYNDLYYNTAGMIGTCFFAWLLAHLGFSWWSLGFLFLCTASVYRTEFRRFNRNIRDDLKRIVVEETLTDRTETTLWLNSFLSKFWVIYMPVLSQQVKDVANPTLAGVAPGYGIDALSLDEFTLGTKSPTIDGIKSYTKRGKDTAEMDWVFSFTPNDVSNMTAKEAKEKINPKIALGVTIGKGFVSKSLPVLVENINVAGKLRVTIKFGQSFPNIEIVSISLLEPPFIDFALKPVGGDTLGLDVMSFLPGLKTFVKTMINSNVGPMLYNPNKLDINVQEIMKQQAQDAIGVVAVTINSAKDLQAPDFAGNSVDPYVTLTTDRDITGVTPIRTTVKSSITSPVWNETKYLLVTTLEQTLSLNCFDLNDLRKDTLIGKVQIDMKDFYQRPSLENQKSKIVSGGKNRGTLDYDIHWLPVTEEKPEREDGDATDEKEGREEQAEEGQVASDVGIIKLTLHKVKDLKGSTSSTFSSTLSPSAEMLVDGKVVKKYRTLRRIKEPSWQETNEVLIPSKKNCTLEFKVFDETVRGKELLCEYSSTVEDLMALPSLEQMTLRGSSQGQIIVSAQWKPVAMTGSFAPANARKEPIGAIRLHLMDALISENLSGVGDIDPYAIIRLNRKIVQRTHYFSENRSPNFNTVTFVPITSENQKLSIELMDYQHVGKDRHIGSYDIPVTKLVEKDHETGKYVPIEQGKTSQCRLLNEKMELTKSYFNVSMSFIPILPVYGPDELARVEQLEAQQEKKKKEFEKEQLQLREEMEKHPDKYEVVEVEDTDQLALGMDTKEKKTLDELLKFNQGVINLQILRGTLTRKTAFLQLILDDFPIPVLTTAKATMGKIIPDNGTCFIRDLDHSRMTFRITRKEKVSELDEIFDEFSIGTKDLLKSSYEKPHSIKQKGCEIELRMLYTPAAKQLPDSETASDTGVLKLNVISAEDVPSHDRNGASDPFVVFSVDGRKIEKTEVIRKTLSPVWNQRFEVPIPSRSRGEVKAEIYDWDRAGSNDLLCSSIVDLKTLIPGKGQEFDLSMEPQGKLKLGITFEAGYLYPPLDPVKGSLTGKPWKVIGGAANVGMGVAGAGMEFAGAGLGAAHSAAGMGLGGVSKGARLLRGKTSKKSKSRENADNSDIIPDNKRAQASGEARKSLDFDPSKPNNSYAKVQTAQQPATQQKNGEGSSIAGAPGPIHTRSPSSTSSFARTLAPNGTYKGKVTIVAAENIGKAIQIRVSLAQGGRMKHLYRTENRKTDGNGFTSFDETCSFKASPEANLVFGGVLVHKLSKDTDLGIAQINLGDPHIQQEGQLSLRLGKGHLIVKIDYGSEDLPPVPDIPFEYKN
ncbi:LAMI_0G09450g1_1 [Lachancea mirantina]|uniref:LAMI_0G09450g1_1 n=1 Tax=Lachancea mirantina TaxID=1230905 RepID=A0A1G4KAH6_9SACH|nr:LAMI_0G09450g1_1 [Lachancea mirantina]